VSRGKRFLLFCECTLQIVAHRFSLSLSSGGKIVSRVIAVSIPDHQELWSSPVLPGESLGSPVVYQTRSNQTYIALTHNSDMLMGQTNETVRSGHFTLLRADNGQVVWTESELTRIESPVGYGPPGIASSPVFGNYNGGLHNQNDLVAWTNSDERGRGNLGNTFAFQLPMNFLGTENEVSNLASVILKTVRWTATVQPVFGTKGRSMFIGASGNQMRGWTGNSKFEEHADWSSDLSTNGTNYQLGRWYM